MRWKKVLFLLKEYMLVPVRLLITVFVASFLAISGPFGSYDALGPVERFLYWFTIVFMSVFVVNLGRAVAAVWLPRAGGGVATLFSAVLAAVLLPPLSLVISVRVFGGELSRLPDYSLIVLLVLAIVVFVGLLRDRLAGVLPQPREARPRLLARLSGPRNVKILRISARDHYVDVHTDRGRETLLMRFSDALAELDGVPGQRVHRSHWVATGAVSGYRREGARGLVELIDGSKVPVSRAMRAEVEAGPIGAKRGAKKRTGSRPRECRAPARP